VVGGVEEDNGEDKCILPCTALHNSQLRTLDYTKLEGLQINLQGPQAYAALSGMKMVCRSLL
jgi:hypothetical protein